MEKGTYSDARCYRCKPSDYFPCRKCGKLTHIDALDAKPELGHEDNENADFTRLECADCYGPGYITARGGPDG